MELTREMLEDMKRCHSKSCSGCKCEVFCEDYTIEELGEKLASLLLAEMDKPKVWNDIILANFAKVIYYSKEDGYIVGQIDYTRPLPKSRIDLIAEKLTDDVSFILGRTYMDRERKELNGTFKQAILEYSEGEK